MAATQCEQVWVLMEAGRFAKDSPLSDQINRSSGSVMDNIAEGFDRFSRPDFCHFLVISRGSNAEVRSQLYRAKSRSHIPADVAEHIVQDAKVPGYKINNLIRTLDKSEYKSKPMDTDSNTSEPYIEYGPAPDLLYDLPQNQIAII